MNGTYTGHWRDEKCIQNYGRQNLKVRDHSDDLGVDGRTILERILGKWSGRMLNGCIWHSKKTGGGQS